MRTIWVVLGLMFILSSCATKVTSIKEDKNKLIKENSGFILFGVDTNRNLKSIQLSGPQKIKLTSEDIQKGTNYLLVDLKAGTYTIDKINFNNYMYLRLNDTDWKIEVKPQQISYVGHLELVTRGYWILTSHSELVNRSSEALEFMEDNYPNMLASRKLVYGGPGNDNFFDLVALTMKEKQ